MEHDGMQTIVGEKRQAIPFRQLLHICNRVRIPRIQRAYAQGRKEEQLIRENFLTDLFDALRSGSVLELNFVYGSLNDGCLDVLDGQQRLTTLFLLHWYCANAEEDAIPTTLKKFTYETRPESGYFLEDFTRAKIDFKGRRPSDAIRGMLWFSHAYECDPTVISMLRMLDAIHEHYLAAKRASHASSFALSPSLDSIRFYLHTLDGYARTEELYIKMNARGLLLTPFENFKADLVDWLQRQKGDFAKPVSFGGREMDWWQCFVAKIDTVWTDFFWTHSEDSDSKTDDAMLSARLFRLFIRYLLYRRLTCSASETAKALPNDIDVRFLDDSNGEGAESQTGVYLGFEHYKSVLEKVPRAMMDMEHVLDLLKQSFDSFADVDSLLKNPHGDSVWSWVGDKKCVQRTQAIAMSAAFAFWEMENTINKDEFGRWMRVVWNAIQNTDINDFGSQIGLTRSLVAMARLPGFAEDVYGTLANQSDDKQPRAIVEEIRKARMIARLPEGRDVWETEIIQAERAPFFQGMIGFYIQADMTVDQFKHRREMATKLFDESGISKPYRQEHGLLRAMLAQIPIWKNGIAGRHLSENGMTRDARLKIKGFLAELEPVRTFFRELTELPDEAAMKNKIAQTLSVIPEFDVTTADAGQGGEIALFYQRLVDDPRVLDWAAAVESEKKESPVVEWRYGHCMLNFRHKRAARLVLGVDREEMARILMDEFGFSIPSQEQGNALSRFGYFTDFSVELSKNVEGSCLKVIFQMEHLVEIQSADGTSQKLGYGTVKTFPAIRKIIHNILQNDS